MSLDSIHPKYVKKVKDWTQLRDFTEGESAVKDKTVTYLPATKGMILDGMGSQAAGKSRLGQEVYNSYLTRAVFPEYMSDALEIFMGMLHNKSPVIELPPEMEALRTNATELGEPLELLLQRINLEQLTTGRVGLLLDLPRNPDPKNPLPFIALYVAEAMRNWDNDAIGDDRADLKFVILDESGPMAQDDFTWKIVKKRRVLKLMTTTSDNTVSYACGMFTDGLGNMQYQDDLMWSPMLRGKVLDRIPFVFVNSKDISPDPDEAPLIGLARMCAAIYRGEADYRQNLFMQGQDTLVIVGARVAKTLAEVDEDSPLRTGAGSRIEVEMGGDAKYIGVNSQGLSEQRYALENDRKRGEARSGQLIDATSGAKESGSALRTRVGAQTATLNQIANTGALALESILRTCAEWLGSDPKKVKVIPNLEFADYQMSGQDLTNLITAKAGGAPLSAESLHRLMVQGNLTSYDYITEKALLDKEEPLPAAIAAEQKAKGDVKGGGGGGPAPKADDNPAQQD